MFSFCSTSDGGFGFGFFSGRTAILFEGRDVRTSVIDETATRTVVATEETVDRECEQAKPAATGLDSDQTVMDSEPGLELWTTEYL
jgi:hypothetical protein